MHKFIKPILQLTACLALAFAFEASAAGQKGEITGTWKSSLTNRTGQAMESTFKLKAEGEKLTGTVSVRNNDTSIEEGKVKGDDVSFQVTREFNGNKLVIKYSGKLSGDTITGKAESERNGEPTKRDWVAKRDTEAKASAGESAKEPAKKD